MIECDAVVIYEVIKDVHPITMDLPGIHDTYLSCVNDNVKKS